MGRSPSEADTPSRKSYLSSSDSGESGDDDDSDFQLSDRDERNDYEGYEERDSESEFPSELEEEEEDEVRGRRYIRARSQRSGRRLRGGQRGRRRRMGIDRASSSRSRSPIDGWAVGGDDDGWVDVDTPPIIHPFTATPGLTCPLPTTPLGFFQLFVPLELSIFFC